MLSHACVPYLTSKIVQQDVLLAKLTVPLQKLCQLDKAVFQSRAGAAHQPEYRRRIIFP